MIDFCKYVHKHVVLFTNSFGSVEELSGIRTGTSTIFRFKKKWVAARPLTPEDLKDEDFVHWLDSMWSHDEAKLKAFLKHKKEYRNETTNKKSVTKNS